MLIFYKQIPFNDTLCVHAEMNRKAKTIGALLNMQYKINKRYYSEFIDNLAKKLTDTHFNEVNSKLSKVGKRALAENKFLKKDIQIKFANNKSPDIREYLADNCSLCLEAQLLLAKDKYIYVRNALVCNPSTVAETLKILSKDSEKFVRKIANKRLNGDVKIL